MQIVANLEWKKPRLNSQVVLLDKVVRAMLLLQGEYDRLSYSY